MFFHTKLLILVGVFTFSAIPIDAKPTFETSRLPILFDVDTFGIKSLLLIELFFLVSFILLLELNMIKKAWKPYGVDIQMSAPGLKRIVEWGTKKYGTDHSK